MSEAQATAETDPRTAIEVTLTTGKSLTVRMCNWTAYLKIKERATEVLSEKLLGMAATDENLAKSILQVAMTEIDEASVWLINECLEEPIDPNEMHPVDVLRLRDAAGEVTRIGEVLDFEKKLLLAIVAKIVKAISDAGQDVGGLVSKVSSLPGTDGLEVT